MTVGTTSMEHFGEALRDERQRRSVSLEDISQTTKVTVRSLRALESDKFDQLPGGILGKGIVRSYVRCLGLDEGEWVERFLNASGRKNQANTDNDWAAFALNASTKQSQVRNLRLRWAGVVALLLLLAGLGWVVWGFVHQRVASFTLNSSPATPYAASVTSSPAPATPPVVRHTKRAHRPHARSLR